VIQEYKGVILTLEQSEKKRSHLNYMFEVNSAKNPKEITHIIDSANASLSSPARYVNSIRYAHENKLMNTRFVQHKDKMFLIAIQNISTNEELVAYYGKNTEGILKL
jgi:predicted transcriptional regulator